MFETEIKLLSEFVDVNDVPISDDNIFSILDKEWDERTHCRILFFLIKCNAASFANSLFGEQLAGYKLSVDDCFCEAPCHFIDACQYFKDKDKLGYIDILLVFKNGEKKIYMPIEVKLGAEDQPLQLLRYYYHLSQYGDIVYPVYLTPSGKNPSEYSTACPQNFACNARGCPRRLDENTVFKRSFKDIERWLTGILSNENEMSAKIIKQYVEILRRWYKMDELVNKISDISLFNAAKHIRDTFGAKVKEIRKTFFDAIAECSQNVELRYSDGAQSKEAKSAGWNDANNTELILNFDNAIVSICVGTNLYCRRNKENAELKESLGDWCYIRQSWFENLINASDVSQTKTPVIDCNTLSTPNNYIVEWYYDVNSRDKKIKQLIENLERYAKREI